MREEAAQKKRPPKQGCSSGRLRLISLAVVMPSAFQTGAGQSAIRSFRQVRKAGIILPTDCGESDALAIAVVGSIIESEAAATSVVVAVASSFAKAGDVVALADRSDCFGYVVHLLNQRVADGSKADDTRTEDQGEDHQNFGGNYKAGFVIEECAQHDCVSLIVRQWNVWSEREKLPPGLNSADPVEGVLSQQTIVGSLERAFRVVAGAWIVFATNGCEGDAFAIAVIVFIVEARA